MSLIQARLDPDLKICIRRLPTRRLPVSCASREEDSEVSREALTKAMKSTKELAGLPIIANVDFGHANPKAAIPIGGKARIWGEGEKSKVEILEH